MNSYDSISLLSEILSGIRETPVPDTPIDYINIYTSTIYEFYHLTFNLSFIIYIIANFQKEEYKLSKNSFLSSYSQKNLARIHGKYRLFYFEFL